MLVKGAGPYLECDQLSAEQQAELNDALNGLPADALGEVEDGVVVLAVVVINALIGFAQEVRAGRAIAARCISPPEICCG